MEPTSNQIIRQFHSLAAAHTPPQLVKTTLDVCLSLLASSASSEVDARATG
jgi:hypothetical protein